MVMNNKQDGNWGQGNETTRNICIPFYVSTSGYGVYFDDHYRNAKIYPQRMAPAYTSGSQDPIAYYYIGGGSMESVMQNYTALTGRQELPPYWALGYITSKYSFATREEAEQAISKTKNIDIPSTASFSISTGRPTTGSETVTLRVLPAWVNLTGRTLIPIRRR